MFVAVGLLAIVVVPIATSLILTFAMTRILRLRRVPGLWGVVAFGALTYLFLVAVAGLVNPGPGSRSVEGCVAAVGTAIVILRDLVRKTRVRPDVARVFD